MPLIDRFLRGRGGINETLPKQVPENEFSSTVRLDLDASTLQFRVKAVTPYGETDYCTSTVVQVVK